MAQTENALKQAADRERNELLKALQESETNTQREGDAARSEARQERQRVVQRFIEAEHVRDEEQSAMQKKNERNMEDLERRHKADAADRDARAASELQELAARIQATANSETRAQVYEANLEEQAARAIRGGLPTLRKLRL